MYKYIEQNTWYSNKSSGQNSHLLIPRAISQMGKLSNSKIGNFKFSLAQISSKSTENNETSHN